MMRLLDQPARFRELVRTRFHLLARVLHVFARLLHPAYLIRSLAPELLGFHDFQAHVARRTHHRAHRGLQIGGVEIDKLGLRDFFDLFLRHFSHFVAIRFRRAFRDSRRAQQQHRRWRRLQNERERTVRIHRHEHREDHSVRLFLRLGVELLAEIHDVQPVWPQSGSHRWRRRRFARRQLQLDRRLYFLWRHLSLSCLSELLDAREIQLHRRRAPKNRYRNLQPAVVVVDLFHVAVEIRKRSIHDTHLLVALEHHFWLRPILRRMHAVDDRVHFRFRKRWRRCRRAHKSGHSRRRPHHVPGVLIQIHFHQHVSWVRHPVRHHFLPVPYFHHFFHRNQYAADLVLQVVGSHTAL